jgi:YebC/PmpR family DNA-binding regulatory protein
MSGHSKWANIKHRKGAADNKRGKLFTKLAKDIIVAARSGLPDPDANIRLRIAIEKARAANMPKDNIERAVRRGSGEDRDAAAFEEIVYEGYLPHSAAVMIECVTDNRNRTVGEIRALLNRYGGSLAESGAVSWQFERQAYFAFDPKGRSEEQVMEVAMEAGVDDFTYAADGVEFFAASTEFKAVGDALRAANIEVQEGQLRLEPTNLLDLSPDQTVQVMRIIELLDDLDDVQNVYSNLNVTDEAIEAMEGA